MGMIYFLFAILFSLFILLLFLILISFLINNKFSNCFDRSPFECGFHDVNNFNIPYSIFFFLILILFVIFDLEVVFVIPSIFVLAKFTFSMLGFFIFFIIIFVGLIHEIN